MDMTDQESNEPTGASFNHQDPWDTQLDNEAPAEETSTEEADQSETPDPVSDNSPDSVVDEEDVSPPPSNPITMKESLDDYIDEELASSVKALVEKVSQLEADLHKERSKTKAAEKVVEATGKFDGLWESESGKYGDTLSGGEAKRRVQSAMEMLRAGMKAVGQTVPSESELFSKAVSAEYGASMVDAREEALMNRVAQRKSQFVSRANSGQRVGERPEDRAARAVARLMTDRGIR